jgi:putative ABC transport system permease protein
VTVTTVTQDLRYALRSLGKNPGFAAAAIATLALGIGGNCAIFGVVNAIFLRPLPFPEPQRLVRLLEKTTTPSGQTYTGNLLPSRYERITAENGLFDRTTAQRVERLTLTGSGDPVRVDGASLSAGSLALLGVVPALGRTFRPEEERAGEASGVALVSHRLWQERFGGDPSLPGRAIRLDGRSAVVVGVLPAGFHFPYRADVWLPLRIDPSDRRDLLVIARLAPGRTLSNARAQAPAIARRLEESDPAGIRDRGLEIVSLHSNLVREEDRVPLLLLAAMGSFLLLACANLANLILARSTARQRETAIRSALGASRWRHVRQSLSESLLLSALGAGAGLLLARWLSGPLDALMPRVLLEELPSGRGGLDLRLLAFAAAAAVATGLLCGLAPALSSARLDVGPLLKSVGRSAAGGGENRRLLSGFVVLQVAISTLLLSGAFAMMAGFHEKRTRDLGVDPKNLLHAELEFPLSRYESGAQRVRALDEILRRISSIPGVSRAAATSVNPLWGGTWGIGIAPGPLASDPREYRSVNVRLVTPGLLRAMGTALLSGRDVSATDREDSPPVAVVSRRMARRIWGEGAALGQTVARRSARGEPVRMQVVGVAADVADFGEMEETVYLPYRQLSNSEDAETVHLMVRGEPGRSGFAAEVARAARAVDPALALAEVSPMEGLYAESLSQQCLGTLVLGAFGVFGLALAVIGTYGVTAFRVGRRSTEIGIRLALGAQPAGIERLFVRQGFGFSVAGGLLGIAAMELARPHLARALGPGFAGSPGLDAAVVGVLVAAGTLASWAPARRAAHRDPLASLRAD